MKFLERVRWTMPTDGGGGGGGENMEEKDDEEVDKHEGRAILIAGRPLWVSGGRAPSTVALC